MGSKVIDRFVETWGTMGSLWGVNTSIARVHGLLIASNRAWCLEEISDRLAISKSNVSTSLKELRNWGVIRKVLKRGDRREFYTCEPDVWKMLYSIMRERKRREFDPAVANVRDALKDVSSTSPGEIALDRLRQMERMLAALDNLSNKLLASEAGATQIISFFLDKVE